MPGQSLFLPEQFPGVPDRWVRPVARIVGRVLGAAALQELVEKVAERGGLSECAQAILDALNIRVRLRGEPLRRSMAPAGPLIVLGNHPFGILEGLVFMALLPPLRPDVRYLYQQLWQRMPHAATAVFPLRPTTGQRAQDHNARSLRSAIRWVQDGHALGFFAAPRVATWCRARGAVVDPKWSNLVGVLVARAQADVLPLHFAGRNSLLFQATATLLDPLHLTLLIREFLNMKDRTIEVTVGRRMTGRSLGCGTNVQDITERIRGILEQLGTQID